MTLNLRAPSRCRGGGVGGVLVGKGPEKWLWWGVLVFVVPKLFR